MVEDEVIAQQLEALLTPAITSQENYYRQLGLRDRILNLPFMVAVVLLKKGASIKVKQVFTDSYALKDRLIS